MKKWVIVAGLTLLSAVPNTVSNAQAVTELLTQADGLFRRGLTEEARQVYEQVGRQDTTCLESAVWLGNYYFLKGEEKRKQAEAAYRLLPEPNRMQSAFYQEQLKSICQDYYFKADTLVKRALRHRPNDHLQLMAADIEAFKIRVGLSKPAVKKKATVFKLLRSFPGSTVLP